MVGASDATSDTLEPPRADDASGYGVTLTLVGAVLLAFGYYGVVGLQEGRSLGQALPEPFYILALAFLFVLELLKWRRLDAVVLARAIALTAVYGGLFVLAVEGGAYLGDHPEAALEGFVGVTVFAAALVVSVLLYVGYLTVVDTGESA